MLLCQQTHETHVVTVKPSFAVKMINCLYQSGPTGRKMEGLGISLMCSTITMSIAVSVTVSKMEVILHQMWSEN